MRAHDLSFPALPAFSKALQKFVIKLPTPRIKNPDGDDKSPPKFIKYATVSA
jgi:hypothetical protein